MTTEFEKSLQSDRDHAALGRSLHRQPALAVDAPDPAAQARRIKELEAALKPFAHPDLAQILGGNVVGDESIVFQRNKAVLKIGDFRRATAILKGAK